MTLQQRIIYSIAVLGILEEYREGKLDSYGDPAESMSSQDCCEDVDNPHTGFVAGQPAREDPA